MIKRAPMAMTYPEPHKNVTGIDRAGDPLVSLEDDVVPIRDLIGALAHHLYSVVLAPRTSNAEKLHKRITNPRPQDRVVVLDSVRRRDPDSYRGVGYLIAHRAEWWTTDEEWERQKSNGEVYPDEPRPAEPDAWYIQYGPAPADVCRWVNCTVLAVPGPQDRWTC